MSIHPHLKQEARAATAFMMRECGHNRPGFQMDPRRLRCFYRNQLRLLKACVKLGRFYAYQISPNKLGWPPGSIILLPD